MALKVWFFYQYPMDAVPECSSRFAIACQESLRSPTFHGTTRKTDGASGGVVVSGIGNSAPESFLDSDNNIVVAAAPCAVARYCTLDGALDPTFGNGGVVATTDLGGVAPMVIGNAVKYPAMGGAGEKILVAGRVNYKPTRTYKYDYDFALARYNSDGSLDTTFGGQKPYPPGTVGLSIGLGTQETLHSAAVQPDGKIVIVGVSSTYVNGQSVSQRVLARFQSNGRWTKTFGENGTGIVEPPLGSLVKIQQAGEESKNPGRRNCPDNDGGICLGAIQPERHARHQRSETTGWVIDHFTDDDQLFAMDVDEGGNILLAGWVENSASGYDYGVARYRPNGARETDFSGDGFVSTDIAAGALDDAFTVAFQADGKIVAAGKTIRASAQQLSAVRYNADGNLDNEFGDLIDPDDPLLGRTGKVVTPILAGSQADSVAIQNDGKIVVSGRASATDSSSSVALVRYTSNGSLDSTFVGDPASLAINDVSKTEGNGGWTSPTPFSFTVTRSGNLLQEASVAWYTQQGQGAVAGADYESTFEGEANKQTLTMPAGLKSASVTVQVNGDTLKESNETFYVNLTDAAGAAIADSQGVGTIQNDDGKRGGTSVSPEDLTDAALVALLAADSQSLSSATAPIKPAIADWDCCSSGATPWPRDCSARCGRRGRQPGLFPPVARSHANHG